MNSTDQKTIFFVMGIQRSGGSTVLDVFKRNRHVSIFKEKNKLLFDNFMLRPEKDIRSIIDQSKPITFIEAKSETKIRNVSDLFSEFSRYTVKVIWNYRNPVNVFYSRLIKYPGEEWVKDEKEFCKMWNKRNASILEAIKHYPDDIAIVKLEDLIDNKMIFKHLCEFVGIKGKNKFFSEKNKAEKSLSSKLIQTISEQTSSILHQLDIHRRFSPDKP